ncbi:GPW/gp25 family protein [Rapidithrix thailandica]|uniref:GPW/gp25 family protein n=1 Tax=Rapidithrix thailandica TaxID=413964 RepID=A0AAW9SFS5_9BACT
MPKPNNIKEEIMQGTYYKTPIKFNHLFQKKELEKTSLEESIAQYINMVATSSFGECKFDETFGCRFWENDFDLLTDYQTLKGRISRDLKEAIVTHEKRLKLTEVDVQIKETQIGSPHATMRMKKKVSIYIKGFVRKTDRPFAFQGYFYVGPLSYL